MTTHATILEDVIAPREGSLDPVVANYFLKLDFPPSYHARFAELSAKSQEGILSADEQRQLDELLDVNDLIAIMRAKALASLNSHSPPGN